MADDNDSLLREVQEELRREQMEKIWQRYNGLIFGAAALVVIGVGGYKFLETRRISAAEAAGADYTAAENLSDDKKKDEAAKAFATIAENGPAGYAALAKLHLAGDEVKAGKAPDAVQTYESLAKNPAADDLLKSFAQLQAASLKLADADYAEIQNRLTPLAGDDAPFGKSARELLGIAAFKAKKYDEARKYLEPLLIDPDASDAIQDRVKVVMAAIATAEVGGSATPSSAATPPPGTTVETAPVAGPAAAPAKTEAKPDVTPGAGGTAVPDKKP
jgi:hypothetical protein